jgi:hypothetical protein
VTPKAASLTAAEAAFAARAVNKWRRPRPAASGSTRAA